MNQRNVYEYLWKGWIETMENVWAKKCSARESFMKLFFTPDLWCKNVVKQPFFRYKAYKNETKV